MALPKPGEFITAKCSRCNDVTGHVIMVVVDGAINKVECKACGSVHKYRESRALQPAIKKSSVRHVRSGDSRDKAVEVTRGTSVKSTTALSNASAKANMAKIESAWQEAMVRHSIDEAVPYSMNAAFEKGMLIEHSSFGRGEVLSLIRPNKVEILFQEGVKLLRCNLS